MSEEHPGGVAHGTSEGGDAETAFPLFLYAARPRPSSNSDMVEKYRILMIFIVTRFITDLHPYVKC